MLFQMMYCFPPQTVAQISATPLNMKVKVEEISQPYKGQITEFLLFFRSFNVSNFKFLIGIPQLPGIYSIQWHL